MCLKRGLMPNDMHAMFHCDGDRPQLVVHGTGIGLTIPIPRDYLVKLIEQLTGIELELRAKDFKAGGNNGR